MAALPAPELVKPSPTDTADALTKMGKDWGADTLPPLPSRKIRGEEEAVGAGKGVQMTAEEEAELAELMGSDDE